MVLGEVGNFSAYGFAPASLVAPLGTTTVIGWIIMKIFISVCKLLSVCIVFVCSNSLFVRLL